MTPVRRLTVVSCSLLLSMFASGPLRAEGMPGLSDRGLDSSPSHAAAGIAVAADGRDATGVDYRRFAEPESRSVRGCVSRASTAKPLVVGHRGFPAVAPENTLASFRAAIESGTAWVETDGQTTRDGVVVLLHDPTLDRTTNVKQVFPARSPWRVKDFTYSEIQQLDAGSWMNPRFAGERVPLLSDLLALLKESKTGLLLEIKSGEPTEPAVILRVLTDGGWVSGGRASQPLCVNSGIVGSAQQFKRLAPGVEVQVILADAITPAKLQTIDSFADGLLVSKEALAAPVYAGPERVLRSVFAWTVDTPNDLSSVQRFPIAGIITNNPKAIGTALAAARR